MLCRRITNQALHAMCVRTLSSRRCQSLLLEHGQRQGLLEHLPSALPPLDPPSMMVDPSVTEDGTAAGSKFFHLQQRVLGLNRPSVLRPLKYRIANRLLQV